MTAILLAAGVGKRMGSDARPKCLLPFGGKSLLARTLEGLRAAGVEEVAVVTGFGKEAVAEEARAHRGAMRLHLLENPRFLEGAILSLWTARDFLDRDVLIMDADVLCPPSVFERLVGSPHRSGILVDGTSADTGEEQMVFGRKGRVLQITKRPSAELRKTMDRLGESLGFLKLSPEAASQLKVLLEERVKAGEVMIEHEQVYPRLFEKVFVGCERVDGLAWTEIDTLEDLARAEREIFPRWVSPPCINRMISNRFLPVIAGWPLTPNQWSVIGLLLGAVSLLCMAQGGFAAGLAAAALFQFFYIIDNWDGDLARLRGVCSRFGGWLDVSIDAFVQIFLPLALAAGLRRGGAGEGVLWLGAAASAGIALDFFVTLWAKSRGFGPAIFADPARASAGASPLRLVRWLSRNITNENFSIVITVVLLTGLRLPFLWATAVGSPLYGARFFWKERKRLIK